MISPQCAETGILVVWRYLGHDPTEVALVSTGNLVLGDCPVAAVISMPFVDSGCVYYPSSMAATASKVCVNFKNSCVHLEIFGCFKMLLADF